MKTVDNIDWNLIELTEIYETYDDALKLLHEDFGRVRHLVGAAIDRGTDPESMTKPIEIFTVELQKFCDTVNGLKDEKQIKTQTP